MLMDMNMNVLWKNPQGVPPAQIERMNRFWGDESWREAAYRKEGDLFEVRDVEGTNEDVAEAYRQRLMKVAGFKYVPKAIPMRNGGEIIVYNQFFASPNRTDAKIIVYIFNT